MVATLDSFGFQWHITDRCPGKCRHCYQSRFDGGAELPLDSLKHIADCIMTSMAVPISINITGGEPLFYQGGSGASSAEEPAVFDLMRHLARFDNLAELNIITGTHGMDEAVVSGLKSLPFLTNVKVSLESHEPKMNDDIRGTGNFEMTSRCIKAMTQAGLSVIVMTTLGRHNFTAVKGLCEYAASLGARGIILERYVPLGKGLALSGFVLTLHEWREIAAAVCRVAALDIPTEELLQYKAFQIEFKQGILGEMCSVSGAACNLGPSSMALMPDGTVFPCRRFPNPIGKLPDDGMGCILSILEGYSGHSQRCYDFDF